MGLIQELREFAVKGNAIDLAVGVIVGGAFGKIVSRGGSRPPARDPRRAAYIGEAAHGFPSGVDFARLGPT